MLDPQLKKGLLDVCVLAALTRGDSYGYKIISDMPRALEMTESTLYPILKRLEAAGMIVAYSVEHSGRLRRYYKILPQGRRKINEFRGDIKELQTIYNFIFGGYDE
jgi:PadR family transcriptional regulator PadR